MQSGVVDVDVDVDVDGDVDVDSGPAGKGAFNVLRASFSLYRLLGVMIDTQQLERANKRDIL